MSWLSKCQAATQSVQRPSADDYDHYHIFVQDDVVSHVIAASERDIG